MSFPSWFHPVVVRKIIVAYCNGMMIEDISHLVGLSEDEVNMVLDHYAPHLEVL